MGLMDRMKAQASQIAERAQEAGKVGQAKIEALQARRKADALLTELGRIAYEAQTGRGAAGDEARRADIVEQLQQYEAEYGALGADGAPSPTGADAAEPADNAQASDVPVWGGGSAAGEAGGSAPAPEPAGEPPVPHAADDGSV